MPVRRSPRVRGARCLAAAECPRRRASSRPGRVCARAKRRGRRKRVQGGRPARVFEIPKAKSLRLRRCGNDGRQMKFVARTLVICLVLMVPGGAAFAASAAEAGAGATANAIHHAHHTHDGHGGQHGSADCCQHAHPQSGVDGPCSCAPGFGCHGLVAPALPALRASVDPTPTARNYPPPRATTPPSPTAATHWRPPTYC